MVKPTDLVMQFEHDLKKGMSNAAYHANTTHLSSSGLKLILQDPGQFYKEYVLGQRVVKDSPALTEGSLVHSLILEPHLVSEQYVVFPGSRRTGRLFDEFKAKVPSSKTIVTEAQMHRSKELAKACRECPEAMVLLSGGMAEHSMVSQHMGVPVKARADYINTDLRYIVDVKTTSKATGPEIFAETVIQFGYDLSAYLYCLIASQSPALYDFYWIVISKADKGVQVIKAGVEDMRQGMAKVEKAIDIYKRCKQTGIWALPEPKIINVGGPVSITFKTSKGAELPTMNLKGKPYLQVAHRLVALNDDVPRFVIRTQFIKIDSEETVCQAEVMLLSQIGEAMKTATATKRETKKDFADHTEKAETGAIGRALAMLGFGTQFATQDMDEGERLADAPVQPAKRTVKKVSGDDF